MNEKLLQYLWQLQCYNHRNLLSQAGEPIDIIRPGTHNVNQGPDFLDAKIKLGGTVWAGHIELHVRSSDWKNHNHSSDSNYNTVILHVVWEDDSIIQAGFPTLELKNRISKTLLDRYSALQQSTSFIPCEKGVATFDGIGWTGWTERLLVERLVFKSGLVIGYLKMTHNHWEETFWWMLAKNFGIKINSEAFEMIARSIPVNVLAKHKNQIHQVEALLLGQANLLSGELNDEYCTLLQREYAFLQKKYNLQPVEMAVHFLRMRPSNFPTVRLAQLAMLVHNSSHLFSKVIISSTARELLELLDVTANDYWLYHYLPGELSSFKQKKLGRQMAENIIINTIVPVVFAYGHYLGEGGYKEKALQWLDELPAEKNSIVQGYSNLGRKAATAFASQALLQLKNNYCNNRRCLECAVGNHLLKATAV